MNGVCERKREGGGGSTPCLLGLLDQASRVRVGRFSRTRTESVNVNRGGSTPRLLDLLYCTIACTSGFALRPPNGPTVESRVRRRYTDSEASKEYHTGASEHGYTI